jgi:hypothetical protein
MYKMLLCLRKYFYSFCNPAIPVSVCTFIYDWKTSLKYIQKCAQKGVKIIVGTVIYVDELPCSSCELNVKLYNSFIIYFPGSLLKV